MHGSTTGMKYLHTHTHTQRTVDQTGSILSESLRKQGKYIPGRLYTTHGDRAGFHGLHENKLV